jgi:hypothetical protein
VEQFTQLEAQAMIFAEVANSINEKSAQQFKEMMELFKKELGSKGNVPNPSNPNQEALPPLQHGGLPQAGEVL